MNFLLVKPYIFFLTVLSHVYVIFIGKGRAVSACPVPVPHSPGKGVYRAGSRSRGWTDRPGGWINGRWTSGPSTAGAEGLYSLLT